MNTFSKEALLLFFALLGLSVTLTSCTSHDVISTPPEPTSKWDTSVMGFIVGNVNSFDYKLGVYPLSGVRVEIDSSPFVAYTDSTGYFSLKAPTGTHILRYSKEGYGEIKRFQVMYFAPFRDTIGHTWLIEKPNVELTDITVTVEKDTFGKYYTFEGRMTPFDSVISPWYQPLFGVFKNDPQIDTNQEPFITSAETYRNDGRLVVRLREEYILAMKEVGVGDTVYVALQLFNMPSFSFEPVGYYVDPFTQKVYYTAASRFFAPVKIVL